MSILGACGACSTAIRTAPPHSPPTPNPCAIRSTTSATADHIPQCAYDGNIPTQKVAGPHHHQSEHQHRLAANPVAKVPDDDAADWPRHKSSPQGRERRERPYSWIEGRELQPIQDKRGRHAVEVLVVPFDRRADQTGERDDSNRDVMIWGRRRDGRSNDGVHSSPLDRRSVRRH